jgi:diadenosine tetraphosphate (Ap4A) HIT family hydrolase
MTFADKFMLNDLAVARLDQWVISVRPKQVTLGALVLSLTRPCEELGGLTAAETQKLAPAFTKLESVLKDFVEYERINYLALMMVDHQVHFHVLPRYSGTRKYGNCDFPDVDWPGPIQLGAPGSSEIGILFQIAADLKQRFANAKVVER